MEFNTLTLKPTYKLCWGSAGSSNALDIAQALGFDSKVLAEARILARMQSSQQQQQQQGTMEQVASSIEAQLAAARESVAALHAVRGQKEKLAEAYRDKTRQLMGLRCVGYRVLMTCASYLLPAGMVSVLEGLTCFCWLCQVHTGSATSAVTWLLGDWSSAIAAVTLQSVCAFWVSVNS